MPFMTPEIAKMGKKKESKMKKQLLFIGKIAVVIGAVLLTMVDVDLTVGIFAKIIDFTFKLLGV